MSWVSKRSIRWSTPTARNIWWFRKEVKKYLKEKSPDEVNFNANTWKWLFEFFDYLWNYRRSFNASIAALHHEFVGNHNSVEAANLETNVRRNFKEFLSYASQRLLGIELVMGWNQERAYPKYLCKAARDTNRKLIWLPIPTYEEYKLCQEIKWCNYNKDWFLSSAFNSVMTYANLDGTKRDSPQLINIACPSYFTCSICGTHYHDHPHNKQRHKTMRDRIVCPKCITASLSNKPHTESTIYGDYHSHYRSGGWKFYPIFGKNDSSVPLGIELEMQHKRAREGWDARSVSWKLYQHQLLKNKEWNYFYCERDGSIGEYGLEMVTQPMTQKVHDQFWGHMLPAIREEFTGWQTEKVHGPAQYGIHVTFDVKLFGNLNLARLIKFIENTDNKVFIQAMAQRGVLYGTSQAIAAETKKVSDVVYYEKGKMLGSKSRSQPVNLKNGELCEIRMFRSTLNTVSFFKNLEFLWAFHQWCGETPFMFKADQFIEWLLKRPTLYFQYPNLYEYLCHKTFPIKVAQHSTTNVWKGEFDKIVLLQKKGQKDLFQTGVDPDPVDYN